MKYPIFYEGNIAKLSNSASLNVNLHITTNLQGLILLLEKETLKKEKRKLFMMSSSFKTHTNTDIQLIKNTIHFTYLLKR